MIYAKYIKRPMDIAVSAISLLILAPLLVMLTITGTFAMGGNPFFVQPRPGKKDRNGNEVIFKLIKFRTMNNKKVKNGSLLPDQMRLTRYGRLLRASSLDELPELLNIICGDLSLVGPRPQLVRDMTFMTPEQRRRHDVRPGLTGLAQVNGRNNISWEQKFAYDLQYIDQGITFAEDMKIIFQTFGKVLRRSDVVREGTASDLDFGDWLMQGGRVDQETYTRKQAEAREMLETI
ncbi:MAG: sugar transferase [Clostridia bacterium]|nr:sugar transferase [Clostridia bacterium]